MANLSSVLDAAGCVWADVLKTTVFLASLGDFATRRLPQDSARLLDGWLAQGVDTSRAQLGERWLNVYLTSPLWRFAWAPGVLDASWWFGLLMPSVDNASLLLRPSATS